MNAHDRDPLLDAFERRLATVERFIPVRPPAMGQSVERPAIKVVGGSAVRRRRRGDGNRVRARLLAPIGIAAVIVLAVVGVGYLSRPGSGPGSGPAGAPPVGSSSAPAAICAAPIPSHPQTVSSPCRYRSTAFQPPIELQLEAGWELAVDTTHELAFQTDLSTKPEIGTLTIATLDNISQTPCLASGGAGPTRPWTPSAPADGPQALMDWIESESGVPHSPPSPITIDGHAGLETVLSPGVGSLRPCGGVVHLMSLGAAGRDLQIRENEALRLDAIVVGDRTVVVIAQAPRAVLLGDLAAKADPIIGTIAFR